jgi:hypothetical protein
VGKPEGKRQLRRAKRGWKDNIKIYGIVEDPGTDLSFGLHKMRGIS